MYIHTYTYNYNTIIYNYFCIKYIGIVMFLKFPL